MYNSQVTKSSFPFPVRRLSIEKTIKSDLKDFEVLVEKGKWFTQRVIPQTRMFLFFRI